MKEPIAKFMRYGNVNQSNNRQTEGKNREKYCWKFNKNKYKIKIAIGNTGVNIAMVGDMACIIVINKLPAKNGNATPSGNTTVPNQNGNDK